MINDDNPQDEQMPEKSLYEKQTSDSQMLPEDTLEQTITNPTTESIENMEVHHHPQVEKKNLKEYLLEGLMIFLAVTMGFIAENIREHISDREKEKQYIHLLRDDLKKDTAALHYSIRRLQTDIVRTDSLIVLFAKNQLKTQNDSYLAQLTLGSGLSIDIVFNDRAASQLKGTGSMRLINHVNVTDSILDYWDNQIRLKEIHDRFENTRQKHREIGYKIFNWYIPHYKNSGYAGVHVPDTSINNLPIKAIYNDGALVEFIDICSNLLNTGSTQYMPLLKKQLSLATGLIALLNKEYNLENE